jgi:hypothetical protein
VYIGSQYPIKYQANVVNGIRMTAATLDCLPGRARRRIAITAVELGTSLVSDPAGVLATAIMCRVTRSPFSAGMPASAFVSIGRASNEQAFMPNAKPVSASQFLGAIPGNQDRCGLINLS